MKNFILGIIVTLIIGAWITLAVVGVIPVKTAILIPVGIVIGFLITIWIFGLWWNSQEIKENIINKELNNIQNPSSICKQLNV